MKRIPVLSADVTAGSFTDQVQAILSWARARESRTVCVANVHMVIEAHRNAGFARVLREADMVTPDGMPLVWVMRRRGAPMQERVAGMDLLPALCSEAERMGIRVFFLGCTEEVLSAIRQRLRADYPGLALAGMVSPPFRPLTGEEDERLVAEINASGAGLVFVALGCPKQERWMNSHRGRVRAVMVGVGGAFPVMAGVEGRAPCWMQKAGLEWLHRLIRDPRRLWRRYLITNSAFIWNVGLELAGLKRTASGGGR